VRTALCFQPLQVGHQDHNHAERFLGFHEIKPANIHVTVLKGQWTEESAQKAVRSWLKLSTSQKATVDVVVSQNDSMAIGARKAFQELSTEYERDRWLSLPYLGIDGVPKTGQSWVRSGLLKATICCGLLPVSIQRRRRCFFGHTIGIMSANIPRASWGSQRKWKKLALPV
jgi:hypothetical protein